jgi:hypothetical protein
MKKGSEANRMSEKKGDCERKRLRNREKDKRKEM